MSQRTNFPTDKEGTVTDIARCNGKVQITINGVKTTYIGQTGEINKLGEILIDGMPIKPFDKRIVPNNSFSVFAGQEKSSLASMAAQNGLDFECDEMGNISFGKK